MTTKTSVMRVGPTRYREGHSTIRRAMTTAAPRADRDVLRMIEFAIETAQRRKSLYCSGLNILMTDRANWTGATGKLRRMTAGARRVLIFSR